jgi:uncharacterized protein (TIRG00374 family)
VVLVGYFLVPQLLGAHQALTKVGGADLVFVTAALALEAGSLTAYTALTQTVLGPARTGFWRQLQIDLTSYGVSHVAPGGGATAAGLRYHLMTSVGVRGADALTCTALEAAAELVSLVVIFTCGLALTASHPGQHPFVVASAGIAVVVSTVVLAVGAALRWRPQWLQVGARAAARAMPFVDASSAGLAVTRLARRAEAVTTDVRLLATTTGWAIANWLLDVGCLWASLRAFGYQAPVETLLVVYGVAALIAMMPVTPGGLGLVEGVVIPVLVSFAAPRSAAVLGVLLWRLIAFWLPIPVSWATAASLRRHMATQHATRRQVPR